MTIQRNDHPEKSKVENTTQGNVDSEKSGVSKSQIALLVIMFVLIAWFAGWVAVTPDVPLDDIESQTVIATMAPDADGFVNCEELTTDECENRMRYERENRAWLDSPEGQEAVAAAAADTADK